MSARKRLLLASILGLCWGAGCFALLSAVGAGAVDFEPALGIARDLLKGNNPYTRTPGPYWVPYPVTAGFLAMPVAGLPDAMAAAAFVGFSVGMLSWAILRSGESWRLAMLFSWPLIYASIYAQSAILMCAMWFIPALGPLVLYKPNIALPFLLTSRPRWRVIAVTVGIFLVSLALKPDWPWVWLSQIRQYQGSTPPLLALPFGPLVLLSLIRWRERRAWLILSMALMPQRVFYDQLPLLLVAQNKSEMFPLFCASWVSFLVLWVSPSMAEMPGGWQTWVAVGHYLPAVGVLLYPEVVRVLDSWRSGPGVVDAS